MVAASGVWVLIGAVRVMIKFNVVIVKAHMLV